jgi:hypothetical protein
MRVTWALPVVIAAVILDVVGVLTESRVLQAIGLALAALTLATYAVRRPSDDATPARRWIMAALIVFGATAAAGLLPEVAAGLGLAYGVQPGQLPCPTCLAMTSTVLNPLEWGMILTAIGCAGLLPGALLLPGPRPRRATIIVAVAVALALPSLVLLLVPTSQPWAAVPSMAAAAIALGAAVVSVRRSRLLASGLALLAVPALFAIAATVSLAGWAERDRFIMAPGVPMRFSVDPGDLNTITPMVFRSIAGERPLAPTVIAVAVSLVEVVALVLVCVGVARRRPVPVS